MLRIKAKLRQQAPEPGKVISSNFSSSAKEQNSARDKNSPSLTKWTSLKCWYQWQLFYAWLQLQFKVGVLQSILQHARSLSACMYTVVHACVTGDACNQVDCKLHFFVQLLVYELALESRITERLKGMAGWMWLFRRQVRILETLCSPFKHFHTAKLIRYENLQTSLFQIQLSVSRPLSTICLCSRV